MGRLVSGKTETFGISTLRLLVLVNEVLPKAKSPLVSHAIFLVKKALDKIMNRATRVG